MIIVDDSTNDEVRTTVESLQGAFSEKGVALVYLHNPGKRSLPVSRNYGAKHAMGDIVMFLDDDVVLEPGYNEGILEVYAQGAHVKGVTGFRMDNPRLTLGFRITNAFDRVFFIFGYTEDRCELLPSWYTIYPHTLTKVISCEWFSGCNQSYLRSVMSELQFDEKLMRYAPGGEDLDFSYRVHRKYPGSLFITPKARFLHHYSPAARTPAAEPVPARGRVQAVPVGEEHRAHGEEHVSVRVGHGRPDGRVLDAEGEGAAHWEVGRARAGRVPEAAQGRCHVLEAQEGDREGRARVPGQVSGVLVWAGGHWLLDEHRPLRENMQYLHVNESVGTRCDPVHQPVMVGIGVDHGLRPHRDPLVEV